jgi:hypothetical protein
MQQIIHHDKNYPINLNVQNLVHIFSMPFSKTVSRSREDVEIGRLFWEYLGASHVAIDVGNST